MPIYLYRNLATGETFEYQQKFADDAFTTHPETGEPVKRLIQPVGISFKGSGFYVNDARKSAKAPAAHSGHKDADHKDSGASSSEAKSASTSSDGAASGTAAASSPTPATPAPAPSTPASSSK